MPTPTPPPPAAPQQVADDEVFALTTAGQAQLNQSGTALSREAIEVLVLIDGRSSAIELMRGMPVLAPAAVREKLGELLAAGLIRNVKSGGSALGQIDPGDFFKTIGKPVKLMAGEGEMHSGEAVAGLGSLQERGYYVRIAKRAAARPQKPEGAKKVALVVDDDPDIGALLGKILRLEGYETLLAANKAQVLEALRRTEVPDIAFLDVTLPDVDGFHILSRMRQHPQLKVVPIVMLTASATRGDVLKGLHFGADAYVTKPFNYEALMKAMHTVLSEPPAEDAPKQ